jgi:hypothetical protein
VPQEFFVTCRLDKWLVDEGPEAHGPYLSRHDAIADAIDAAERLVKPKKRFDVLLKLPGSSAELLWSSKTYFADRRGQIALPGWNSQASRKPSRIGTSRTGVSCRDAIC